ncbi:sugar phosphate isomerase/epimerase family protein [Methanoregula sp.]|uniref:sugar phosphate isomerase/epimerase family protein n=1 Tax=Methanoregula sp. TaxID=2052170 RepID=UPI003BB1ED2F
MTLTHYGCSTFCCMDLPLDQALDLVLNKTNRIEIMSEGYHDLFRFREACHSVDARYSVHAPISDINLASVNDRIRRTSLEVIDDLCGICDDINAETLVVHPGYFPWSHMQTEAREALVKSLASLSAIQSEHDTRIAVENMGSWECFVFRNPEFLSELEHCDIGFVLDVGHAQLNNQLMEFANKSRPCHIHLHDNTGTNDDHAACGDGTIDFTALLPLLPVPASRIIECRDFSGYEKSLAYLSSVEDLVCRKKVPLL